MFPPSNVTFSGLVKFKCLLNISFSVTAAILFVMWLHSEIYIIFACADVIAGVNQFCQDIVDMICHCPPWCTKLLWYFKACWVVFTPFLLTVGVLFFVCFIGITSCFRMQWCTRLLFKRNSYITVNVIQIYNFIRVWAESYYSTVRNLALLQCGIKHHVCHVSSQCNE